MKKKPAITKPVAASACSCWSDRNKTLSKEYGLRISDACEMLTMSNLNLGHTYCLPLQRADGAKIKRADPKTITISHCPFCGAKLA